MRRGHFSPRISRLYIDWKTSGGRNWLDLTRGTDCTEAFQTFHVFGVPQSTLSKFWVRKASTPRRYRFTFYPDGFFKTLQRKAAKVLKETGTGPDWSSSLLQDFLTFSFLFSFFVLCFKPTFGLALATGLSENSVQFWREILCRTFTGNV